MGSPEHPKTGGRHGKAGGRGAHRRAGVRRRRSLLRHGSRFRNPSPTVTSAFDGQRQSIVGVLAVTDNGFVDLGLDAQGLGWVIWPDTTQTKKGGAGIVVGGHVVADGDALRGSGTVADGTPLPVWDKTCGIPLEMLCRYCSADQRGVVVLDGATVMTG